MLYERLDWLQERRLREGLGMELDFDDLHEQTDCLYDDRDCRECPWRQSCIRSAVQKLGLVAEKKIQRKPTKAEKGAFKKVQITRRYLGTLGLKRAFCNNRKCAKRLPEGSVAWRKTTNSGIVFYCDECYEGLWVDV